MTRGFKLRVKNFFPSLKLNPRRVGRSIDFVLNCSFTPCKCMRSMLSFATLSMSILLLLDRRTDEKFLYFNVVAS